MVDIRQDGRTGKSFTLKGLAPGATYIISVQAIPKNGKNSPWSKPIKFNTNTNDVAPPAIESLVASFDGAGFSATWDGSAALAEKDFLTFRVIITSDNYPSVTKTYDVRDELFSMSKDTILFAFGGITDQINIEVKSVDRSGNESEGVSVSAGNQPPSDPTNVVVVSESLGYSVSWDLPPEPDYAYSKIYESSTVGGEYTNVINVNATPSSIKTGNFNTRFVKVSHVDSFGGESGLAPSVGIEVTPTNPVSVDIDPPDQRGNIVFTAAVGGTSVSWTNPTDEENNSDIAGVSIRYAKTASPSNYTWVSVPFTFSSPLTSTDIEGLLPATSYDFELATFDKTQNYTAYSTSQTVVTLSDSTPPPSPAAPGIAGGSAAGGPFIIRVTQESIENGTTDPLPLDTSYFKVFMLDDTYTDAPGVGVATNNNATEIGTLVAAFNGGSSQSNFYVPLTDGEQRYFYTRAVDTSSNTSDASPSVQSDAMLVIENAYISDLSADKIRAGRINADEYIQVGTSSEQITIESTDLLGKIYSGVGTYNNTNTGIYIDTSGKFSLKDRLTFDGTDLSLAGSITATGGSFTGNVQLSGGSLYAGLSPSSGARVILNQNGLTSYNSSGTATFSLDAASGGVLLTGYLTVGSAAGDVNAGGTNIVGNKIRTGIIQSNLYSPPSGGSEFSSFGAAFDLTNAEIRATNFYIAGGNAGFLGVVESLGLIVDGTATRTHPVITSTGTNNEIYSLLSLDGKDMILGAGAGIGSPAKIRWLDTSNGQRATIGWETGSGGSQYPETLVIRANSASGGNAGSILIDAGNFGSINLRAAAGGVLINGSPIGSGGGGVSSVGLSAPAGFSVSGSPITSSGTLAISLGNAPSSSQVLRSGSTTDVSWGQITGNHINTSSQITALNFINITGNTETWYGGAYSSGSVPSAATLPANSIIVVY